MRADFIYPIFHFSVEWYKQNENHNTYQGSQTTAKIEGIFLLNTAFEVENKNLFSKIVFQIIIILLPGVRFESQCLINGSILKKVAKFKKVPLISVSLS